MNTDKSKTELPKWKCHKEVSAFKIGKIEGLRIFSSDGSMHVDVSQEYIVKHPLNKDGYFVQYEDGYQSFSPANVFEAGYTSIP